MPLPENLTIDSVLHGTRNIPPKLNQFFQYLICGPDSRRWKIDAKHSLIQSVSQDVIFAASSGRKLPSKHLKLGVALKSLTDSRKVVEEIETELTFNATELQMERQDGMSACNKGGKGCNFDNFHRFVESQSGKDTFHNTVGISYELVFPEINGSSDAESNDKNTQEKTTDDSETYPTNPSSAPVN